jgi:pyruvate dehydrogenase E1 component alpha subunit
MSLKFENYNPAEDKLFQLMDNTGGIITPSEMPDINEALAVKAYKDMLFSRTADAMAVSFQRQGRMYTYPSNYGQEAIAVATGLIMREDDWMVPAFRELAAWLAKGVTLKEIFLYYMGNEEGSAFKQAKHMLPFSVPISSQLLHAVGIGYAINQQKKDEVVFAFVGDGGTSEGDFSEALNFAAVWKVPVVFIVQNNQYAISVPVRKQTKSINIAVKAMAFGMPGIKVDGNDIFAMYAALKHASDYARAKNGPVLIEGFTYRKGAHTTSDDPSKYRTKEEEQEWEAKDPLKRLKYYLDGKGLWTEDEETLIDQYKQEVERQFEEAENTAPYRLEDVFRYTHYEMPDELRRQKAEYEKYLLWKEGRK